MCQGEHNLRMELIQRWYIVKLIETMKERTTWMPMVVSISKVTGMGTRIERKVKMQMPCSSESSRRLEHNQGSHLVHSCNYCTMVCEVIAAVG